MLELPKRRWLLLYLLLWFGVALSLSLSELQRYLQYGRAHPWEPFLWEFSSVAFVALLALGIHALVKRLAGQPMVLQLGAHVLGFLAFTTLHVAGMFSLRFAVYGWLQLRYDPGPWPQLLAYEAGQDAVSYLLIALLSLGVRAWRTEQARAAELERVRRELAEAQAARLAEQVQPHFLFNTLNLIAATVHEDAKRADALICELASLLRQTSQAQQRAEHPLADELALVRPFLVLMQARFGERLKVEMDVEKAAGRVLIPALLLLSPVENAIKHDVAQHREPVCVRLQARLGAGRLSIELFNSGVVSEPDASSGLGLANLRERLRARYGEAARAAFGPAQGGGTRLLLELPA